MQTEQFTRKLQDVHPPADMDMQKTYVYVAIQASLASPVCRFSEGTAGAASGTAQVSVVVELMAP